MQPKTRPDNQRPEPDEFVLDQLTQYRAINDAIHSDKPPTLKLKITLDLEENIYAIDEEWCSDVSETDRAWLTAFAGVSSIMRFAAYLPPEVQREAINKLAAGTEWLIDTWFSADGAHWDDAIYEVEVYRLAHRQAAPAYVTASAPDGLTIAEVGEPIALLRRYLLAHSNPRVARACKAAYEKLSKCHDPLIGDTSGKARVDAQILIPRDILRDLSRREFFEDTPAIDHSEVQG